MKDNSNENVFGDQENQKLQLVQVKAQVMRWDKSTGLWGQCVGGGMSRVFLYKIFEPLGIDSNRVEKDSEAEILLASQDIKSFSLLSLHTVVPPSNVAPKAAPSVNLNNSSPTSSKNLSPTAASLPLPSTPPLSHHYSILAQRISDNATLINCCISSDLEYSRATKSMLHHWSVTGCRYGLTFQSSHEATIFQRAVLSALDVLKGHKNDQAYHEILRLPTSPSLPLSGKHISSQVKTISKVKSSSSSSNLHFNFSFSSSALKDSSFMPLEHHPSSVVCTQPPATTISPPSIHLQDNLPTSASLITGNDDKEEEEGKEEEEEEFVLPPPRMVHGQSVCMTYRKPRAITPPCSPEHQVILLSHLPSLQSKPPITFSSSFSPHKDTYSKRVTLDKYIGKLAGSSTEHSKEDNEDDDDEVFDAPRRQSSGTESYVHLTKDAPATTSVVPSNSTKHDYSYPTLHLAHKAASLGRFHSNSRMSLPLSHSSTRGFLTSRAPSSFNLNIIHPPSTSILPRKSTKQPKHLSRLPWRRSASIKGSASINSLRARCFYCQEFFTIGDKSLCKDAPDKHLKRIRAVTCYSCLQAALYHCGPSADEVERSEGMVQCRKGLLTSLVCLVLPCLCLYPPLRACHSCSSCFTAPTHRRDINN